MAQPVNAIPAMISTFITKTGDSPSHASGAPITPWTNRCSENASV